MEHYQRQLVNLSAGVAIATVVWVITHWSRLELDWKGELKALLGPVVVAVAGMFYADMAYPDIAVAALTMLGTAVGLNRKALSGAKVDAEEKEEEAE